MTQTPITPDEFRLRMNEDSDQRSGETEIIPHWCRRTYVLLAGNAGVRTRGPNLSEHEQVVRMTESEWLGEGLAEWQEECDALQFALHALVTEAITGVVSTRDVINSLETATDYLKRKELKDAR